MTRITTWQGTYDYDHSLCVYMNFHDLTNSCICEMYALMWEIPYWRMQEISKITPKTVTKNTLLTWTLCTHLHDSVIIISICVFATYNRNKIRTKIKNIARPLNSVLRSLRTEQETAYDGVMCVSIISFLLRSSSYKRFISLNMLAVYWK